ncbi:hypothetical protein QNH10_19385 [Sporosarcina thermotolerans]|nr:hypothetical protein [Sporosarcina thermotolerans]WHT48159.1 hypothetical protein QNH10_19385 [Sporosarcina thermotolerans]
MGFKDEIKREMRNVMKDVEKEYENRGSLIIKGIVLKLETR